MWRYIESMEPIKTKRIIIVTGPKGDPVMRMHDWLNTQNINHFTVLSERKIFMKKLTLIFKTGVEEAMNLKADGCVCLNKDISDIITNGENILENTTIEDYILKSENKDLYVDIEAEIKKREGWF